MAELEDSSKNLIVFNDEDIEAALRVDTVKAPVNSTGAETNHEEMMHQDKNLINDLTLKARGPPRYDMADLDGTLKARGPPLYDLAESAAEIPSTIYHEYGEYEASSDEQEENIYEPIDVDEDYIEPTADSDGSGSMTESPDVMPDLPDVQLRQSPGPAKVTKTPSFLQKVRESFGRSQSSSVDEESPVYVFQPPDGKKHTPPELPPRPVNLSRSQMKRRMIIQSIVDTENNYVDSLKRLVFDYDKALHMMQPSIISRVQKNKIFLMLKDILMCHFHFQIELADRVKKWDTEEKIGTAFVAFCSQKLVFESYSKFINNYNTALETIKRETRSNTEFSKFLLARQKEDRLPLSGLLVRPVQRFPQYILMVQDLLRHTSADHEDRLCLQLALTDLDDLTHRLNEAKRRLECRRDAEMLNVRMGKRVIKGDLLLREDDFQLMTYGGRGEVVSAKRRRLILLGSELVCVSLRPDGKLRLKWHQPLKDVRVSQSGLSPAWNVKVEGGPGRTVLYTPAGDGSGVAAPLQLEMTNMMKDRAVLGQICALAETLKGNYPTLSVEGIQSIMTSLQSAILQRDEELRMLDSCTITLSFTDKAGHHRLIFKTKSAQDKEDWLMDFYTTRLYLEGCQRQAWMQAGTEDEHGSGSVDTISSDELPVFIKPLLLDISKVFKEAECAVPVFMASAEEGGAELQRLWVAGGGDLQGHVAIVSITGMSPVLTECFKVCDTKILCMEFVPGEYITEQLEHEGGIWLGAADGRLYILAARTGGPGGTPSRRCSLVVETGAHCAVTCIRYTEPKLCVGLMNGLLLIYHRGADDQWRTSNPVRLNLGTQPVSFVLGLEHSAWAACEASLYLIDINSESIKSEQALTSDKRADSHIAFAARCGGGVWLSFHGSASLKLYRTENMQHLQDIDLSSALVRAAMAHQSGRDSTLKPESLKITALSASRGMLWVGTNLGIVFTFPLPRLEGIPLIRSRPIAALHTHNGPVRFLAPMWCGVIYRQTPKRSTQELPPTPPEAPASTMLSSQMSEPAGEVTTPENIHPSRSLSIGEVKSPYPGGSMTMPRSTSLTPKSATLWQTRQNRYSFNKLETIASMQNLFGAHSVDDLYGSLLQQPDIDTEFDISRTSDDMSVRSSTPDEFSQSLSRISTINIVSRRESREGSHSSRDSLTSTESPSASKQNTVVHKNNCEGPTTPQRIDEIKEASPVKLRSSASPHKSNERSSDIQAVTLRQEPVYRVPQDSIIVTEEEPIYTEPEDALPNTSRSPTPQRQATSVTLTPVMSSAELASGDNTPNKRQSMLFSDPNQAPVAVRCKTIIMVSGGPGHKYGFKKLAKTDSQDAQLMFWICRP